MNVLVTGAGGFLGRYIVEKLVARGDRVCALCRREDAQLRALGVDVRGADLRDRAAVIAGCRGMDVVIHAAGVTGLVGRWKHYYQANTLGTQHVVEGCRKHGVGRLVYTSSPSVTFDGTDQKGVDESAPYASRWLCHYPRSKALAEQHVLQSNGAGGLATCALRPHLMWGPGDRHLVPKLLDRARSGRLRRVGNGTNLVDMVYVENAATAHLQAADAVSTDSPLAGRAYFIGQGEPVNCWRWIDQVLALAGLPPVRKSVSLAAAWRMGAALEMIYRLFDLRSDPPMTRFLAAQLATSHYYDISRAKRDFGYEPSVSCAEGMRRLAADFGKRPPVPTPLCS